MCWFRSVNKLLTVFDLMYGKIDGKVCIEIEFMMVVMEVEFMFRKILVLQQRDHGDIKVIETEQ